MPMKIRVWNIFIDGYKKLNLLGPSCVQECLDYCRRHGLGEPSSVFSDVIENLVFTKDIEELQKLYGVPEKTATAIK